MEVRISQVLASYYIAENNEDRLKNISKSTISQIKNSKDLNEEMKERMLFSFYILNLGAEITKESLKYNDSFEITEELKEYAAKLLEKFNTDIAKFKTISSDPTIRVLNQLIMGMMNLYSGNNEGLEMILAGYRSPYIAEILQKHLTQLMKLFLDNHKY